jgi:flavodoxin
MSDKKILTVYYSDSGHTKKIADEITAALSTALERLSAPGLKPGFLGFVQRGWTAGFGRPVTLDAVRYRPADFDLVIVGSPLWAGHVSGPVRTYLLSNRDAFRQVAFFVSAGGVNTEGVFAEMEKLSGRAPLARLSVSDRHRSSGEDIARIQDFVNEIETWSATERTTPATSARVS